MSEGEFKKIRLHLRLLTVCVLILIALLTANLIHRNFNPKSTSFPRIVVVNGKNGKDGVSPQIDYSRIDTYIQAQVAQIPKPQNGVNGTNGKQGKTGDIGARGASGVQGEPGTTGQDGVDGLTLQIRVDPTTCQLQDKYIISVFWITVAQLPKPCEVQ